MSALTVLMTCAVPIAVDGDTVKCDGQNLRPMGDGAPYVAGFDAPEVYGRSRCPGEALLGAKAMVRFAEMIATPGLAIEDSGELDPDGRPLVVLRLPDGSTIGQILINEGLARPGQRLRAMTGVLRSAGRCRSLGQTDRLMLSAGLPSSMSVFRPSGAQ